MLKKFFKHKHSSRLLAWLLVGVMALSSAGVMPVVAADVSGGDAAVVSGGDVSGGNGATKNYLTLDGAEVTYDLRQSTFGAYSKTENTWTAADGICSVSGTISFNDAQHGASVTNGTTFAVNAPAGNVTITLGGCAYGSSSATLYVNGSAVGESVSIGGLAADETDVELSTTLTEAGVVSVVISGNGYLHYVKAKATTPTEDGEGNEGGSGAVAPEGWVESTTKPGYWEKTTTYDFTGTDTELPAAITAVQGKVAKKSGYLSVQKTAKTAEGITGVITMPLDAATTEIAFSFVLTSNNSSRSVKVGEGTTEAVALNTGAEDPKITSELTYATTYTEDYFPNDVLRIEGITSSDTDSAEIKFASITIVEYQVAQSSEPVAPEGFEESTTKPGYWEKTTTYDFTGTDTELPAAITAVQGKVAKKSGYLSVQKTAKTAEGITGVITMPLDAATTEIAFSFVLTSNNSSRSVKVGEGTTEAVALNTGAEDPKITSELTYATTYTEDYFPNDVLRIEGITSSDTDSAEIKFASITIVEYQPISSSGTITPVVKLEEMTLETMAETYNFRGTSTIFGTAAADIEGDSVFSANKYIKITKDASDAWDATTNGHGLTFTKDLVIEVLVPAETMGVFTFTGCDYAACSATMTVGDEVIVENLSLDNGVDAAIPFTYANESDDTVIMKITVSTNSRGYFHGVTYELQELPDKFWAADKTGTVTIGDTTFTVKTGANDSVAYTVTAEGGEGYVEIAGAAKTVVWVNLGGVKLANAVTAGEGFSGASVTGKVVTLTYADTTTLPESYNLEVRDLGAVEEPKQDGVTTSYDLTNGSVVSDLHTNKIANGEAITSEDGNFTVCSNGNVYYHGTQYGLVVNPGAGFEVNVAGNAKIVIYGSSFQTTGIDATPEGEGVIYIEGDETKETASADTSNANPGSSSFIYEGEATTLYFTFTGGTYYVSKVTVKDELPPVPEGNVHPELGYTLPEVINWDNGLLEARIAGQTVTLMNPTKLVKENIKTSGLGIYVFPLTDANNTLTVDVVVNDCDSSTNNAAYVGLFNVSVADDANGIRAITTAIRSSNCEVVQLMSKKDNEVLGKNSFNGAAMELGDVVRITISRDGSNIIQTFTNLTQGTDTVTKKTAYSATKSFLNPDGEVYYGLMVSNRDTVFKNMVYTAADGTVLYDQNLYNDPVGDIPVVTAVTATAAEDRTKITIDWTADDALFDAKYVLQVKKPGTTEWVDVATELTSKNYEYLVSTGESGEYAFRVCGTRGNAASQNLANRNTYVESNTAYIEAALPTPVLTVPYVSAADKVVLSWTASEGATSYEVYRSYDGKAAELIATVTETTYTDTAVTTDVPYYYSVKAISADNYSPLSAEVWTLPTAGHTGDYDENVALYVTDRSYNTVFENKIDLAGVVGAAGTVKVYVNGTEKASQAVASANGTFSFEDVEISAGRNEVELVLEYGNGLKVRKSLNYVYLTHYDYVVDDDFTGTDGTADTNGVPQYKTVAAAIAAANKSTNVILVRNGDYNEKLVITTPNVSLIGEDSEKTRIYYSVCEGTKAQESDNSRYAFSVMQAATNFTAENICIENSWAYLGDGTYSNESAEAIYVEKTNAVFVGVRALSYQDTIQNKDGNIYLLRSYVAGNVDFLWGQRGSATFEDCDIVFRYAALKNSGYYTAYGPDFQGIFNECRFYSEANCGGTKYYLGRPYNGSTAVAFVNCYMGSILNKDWGYATWGGAELSSDPAQYEASDYVECGTYGPGYAVNVNRRQISQTVAADMLTAASLGWNPYSVVATIGTKYVGSIVTPVNIGSVTSEYETTKYSPYESDDTGLGKYNMEGFAESVEVTGGGLLKETDENYYKVATGDEFLVALRAVKDKKGVPSVIEITADISVGINEINPNHESLYGTGVVQAHNPALVNPVLIESGVSKVYIKQMSNLTIFSQNGATIKHGAFNISDSDNIIIRNLSFDELWEWDEGNPNDASIKAGDYDVNDWDYMTIDNGSNGVWIDHCTFYKAYDGIIDIKTSDAYATPMNVTISWCEFMPGSKNNTFFNEMMNYVKENKANMPYYQYLLGKGMTDEQIWWYAYGQKKTHLLGQSDDATANVNLKVTLANNSYYNSMDRMPRLRYGTAHVYNCIMDAQEILDVKKTINAEIASKLVSNGAISTCNGQVLLENCYLNGIQWALISGNGSSPNGSIAAVDSLYYVDGVRYALDPLTKSTVGEAPKITDADAFTASLPYSDYNLYDAADLATVVKPYVGAGKLDMDVLQWEKGTYYDATFVAPEEGGNYDDDELPNYEIPEDVPAVTPTPGTSTGTAVVLPATNDWTAVNNEITTDGAATTEGIAHVETTSTGTIEVPVYVIENLKGKNVSLMLHNGQGVAISITGTMLGGVTAQAVNATVVSNANTIPADVVAQKADALTTKQLSVKNEGAFAVPVNMHVNVGKDYAGNYATLYKYDATTGELVCAGCFKVTEDGQAMFALLEGGEYLLAVTAEMPKDAAVAIVGRYIVKSGDSMYAIARMYKLTLQNLLLKNPQIEDPNMIHVGDKINVR